MKTEKLYLRDVENSPNLCVLLYRRAFLFAQEIVTSLFFLFVLSIPLLANANTPVHYVDVNSPTSISPYISWDTAATVIQDAVDAAVDGDTVLVTNGVYDVGGTNAPGYALTNRVYIHKTINLKSVNGPSNTIIVGSTNEEQRRVIFVGTNATVNGFTITNGRVFPHGAFNLKVNLYSYSVDGHIDPFSPDVWINLGGGHTLSIDFSTNSILMTFLELFPGSGDYMFEEGVVLEFTFIGEPLFSFKSPSWSSWGGNLGGLWNEELNMPLIQCTTNSVLIDLSNWEFGSDTYYFHSYGEIKFPFTNNSNTYGNGGGIMCASLNSVITNCIISENTALKGGGVYGGSLHECIISNNSAYNGGGASHSSLSKCNVYYNRADIGGGLDNCLARGYTKISNNEAAYRGGGTYESDLENCMVLNNNSLGLNANQGYGGGAYSGELRNCTISSNAAVYGGGVYTGVYSHCVLKKNSARYEGGGGCKGSFFNCVLIGNESIFFGGGVNNSTLHNCLISSNKASVGGGAMISTISSSSIVDNSSELHGGGISGGGIYNSIIVSNSPDNFFYPEEFINNCSFPHKEGSGNIAEDPHFVDHGNGDFRLRLTSPCIDAGNNQEWMLSATDIEGKPRILNRFVDIGAYEFGFKTKLKVMLEGASRDE